LRVYGRTGCANEEVEEAVSYVLVEGLEHVGVLGEE